MISVWLVQHPGACAGLTLGAAAVAVCATYALAAGLARALSWVGGRR